MKMILIPKHTWTSHAPKTKGWELITNFFARSLSDQWLPVWKKLDLMIPLRTLRLASAFSFLSFLSKDATFCFVVSCKASLMDFDLPKTTKFCRHKESFTNCTSLWENNIFKWMGNPGILVPKEHVDRKMWAPLSIKVWLFSKIGNKKIRCRRVERGVPKRRQFDYRRVFQPRITKNRRGEAKFWSWFISESLPKREIGKAKKDESGLQIF